MESIATKRRDFIGSSYWLPDDPASLGRRTTIERLCVQLVGEAVKLAESAYVVRDLPRLAQAIRRLRDQNLPELAASLADYYDGLYRRELHEPSAALRLMCRAFDSPISPCRARSLLTIGNMILESGDHKQALCCYREVSKLTSHSATSLPGAQALKMLCVADSIDGNHQRALEGLETIRSVVRRAASGYPLLAVDYLNSLALEMAECGRAEEACRILETVVRSPLGRFYPEFHQSYSEVVSRMRKRSRSAVAILAPVDDLRLIKSLPSTPNSANVISFTEGRKLIEQQNRAGKRERIRLRINLICDREENLLFNEEIDGSQIHRVLRFVERLRVIDDASRAE